MQRADVTPISVPTRVGLGSRSLGALRAAVFGVSILFAMIAFAFYMRFGFITDVWNMPEQPMSYRFMASYVAAFAGSLAWVALTGQIAALRGIAMTVVSGALGIAACFATFTYRDDTPEYIPAIVLLFILAGAAFLTIRVIGRWPASALAQPHGVRIAFVVFTILLIFTSIRALRRSENIFPWDLHPDWSRMIGAMLLASAVFFIIGIRERSWTYAGSQLAGFLVYDLVLAVPYLRMIGDRNESTGPYGGGSTVNQQALAVVLTVISVSAAVAFWYLLINRETRLTVGGESRRRY